MAGKTPGFYLYTGDWLKDPALSKCSEAARGIWIDFLCAMHEDARSGQVTGTLDQLCRIGRCTAAVLAPCLSELSTSGAATVHERKGVFTVVNRRMTRERNARENTRERVKNHRFRKKKRECNNDSSISTSLSSERDNLAVALSPPTRTGQTALENRKGAKKTSERESKSRFSLAECEQYAASLKGVKSPKAFAKTIWRSGEDDDQVAEFLGRGDSGNAVKKAPDKPVDVAELQQLAADLERMGFDKPAEALRASIQASAK
jgi:hypothetical protein